MALTFIPFLPMLAAILTARALNGCWLPTGGKSDD
jgi:hypothetical protein